MKSPHSPTKNPSARVEGRDYLDHSRNLHHAAAAAHAAWIAGMTPAERRRVREMNLESYGDDDSEVGGHSPFSVSDIAESPIARTDTDYAAAIDLPEEILADRFGVTRTQALAILAWHEEATAATVDREKAAYLQIIVGGLLSSKNPKMNAAGLAFAANLDALNGLPCQRQFARENHVSPSAVSKVVKQWQLALGLQPSAHQKSEKACKTYSMTGKANHWRDQPVTAASVKALLTRIKPNKTPATN